MGKEKAIIPMTRYNELLEIEKKFNKKNFHLNVSFSYQYYGVVSNSRDFMYENEYTSHIIEEIKEHMTMHAESFKEQESEILERIENQRKASEEFQNNSTQRKASEEFQNNSTFIKTKRSWLKW